MRAIKGLLLASAAGLAAVSSASAADLPVKAKPVEYVKVCSLYGAGFFYVPGTDTCLKLGMYLRVDTSYGRGSSAGVYGWVSALAPGPAAVGGLNTYTRTATDYYTQRARIALTTDWRTQSDYGVIRAYAAIIAQNQTGQLTGDAATTGTAGILRAFIQFAGFTVGHAASYFDFYNGADYGYVPSMAIGAAGGPNGVNILAYTWTIGNGWSASIDVEDSFARSRRVVNASAAIFGANGLIAVDQLGGWAPDIAGNIRVDQAWGSWQIMGGLHNASGGYYGGVGSFCAAVTTPCGHPGEAWGWAIGTGIKLTNFLAPKNAFEAQVAYAKGAVGYTQTSLPGGVGYDSGNTIYLVPEMDGVFVSGSNVELTESWGFSAAYQHYWNAQWRTSITGGYSVINYGGNATAMLCGTAVNAAPLGGLVTAQVSGVCNPDHSFAQVGTRTAWNPHPTLEIGLDLHWLHINTASDGAVFTLAANGARPAGNYVAQDADHLIGVLRFQKTVLP